MVNSARLELLMKHFADGNISKTEYLELLTHFNLTGNDQELYQAMDAIWKESLPEVLHTPEQEEAIFQKIRQSDSFKTAPLRLRFKPLYRYVAAAVVLIALSIGIMMYFLSNNSPASRFALHDIAPGGNKAMLLLSNGTKIDLSKASNGELLSQSGISISKTKNGELVYSLSGKSNSNTDHIESTIVTPKGGQYQVNLPDGTKVWLNAASSLTFPNQFKGKQREVKLTGEAYFEVAKRYIQNRENQNTADRLPFLVSTATQRVEVLGTHFNIDAYPEEVSAKTTLLEGSVRIVLPEAKKDQVAYLHPGEQSLLKAGEIKIVPADLEATMAWKNGLFMFDGQNLESIMKEVERWYNVEVVFGKEALRTEVFNGSTSRFKNISQLLEVLESTGSVHFKIEGRRITVME